MSWIRSTVSKAVEVGGNNNLTRTVRSYADSVVHQAGRAVAEGAKIVQDRIGTRNYQSFKHAVKRLEEAAVSCRGIERVLLLRRWLVALKEVERISGDSVDASDKYSEQLHLSDESKDSPRKPVSVLYYDSDLGGEPMSFLDVFLQSQALEGMTLSMILEAPNEEEVTLLLEIYGLCLSGGVEVHTAMMSSLQDLANAFSSYEEEILVKREELLQYAQGAVTGLKINAEIARIDSEVSEIRIGLKHINQSADDRNKSQNMVAPLEPLKEGIAQVQLCSRLEALLLKKRLLNQGDSQEVHAQKVDKLKVLSESLTNSALKAEKRISDHRLQKEEALKFRVTKSSEVSGTEKELVAEVGMLERRRDELEAELKGVNTSIAAARLRLHNAREEREQFDEASNEIMAHLKTKEDELSRSIACYRAEADVCSMFVNFLEDTWVFQSRFTKQKEKVVNDELEKCGTYFNDLVIHLLSANKEELASSVSTFKELVRKLNSEESSDVASALDDEDLHENNSRKNLEDEYLNSEAKFISAFAVVEEIKKQLFSRNEEISTHDDKRIEELLNNLEKIKHEFESIERPKLEIGTPQTRGRKASSKERLRSSKSPKSQSIERPSVEAYTPMHVEEIPVKENSDIALGGSVLGLESSSQVQHPSDSKGSPCKSPTSPLKQSSSDNVQSTEISSVENENPTRVDQSPMLKPTTVVLAQRDEASQSPTIRGEKVAADLSKVESNAEKDSREQPAEEIGGWEFDGLEKGLN